VRSRTAVIRVTDNEIDYLPTHCALGIAIPFCNLAKTPTVLGPFEENMLSRHLLNCLVQGYEHAAGWRYAGWLESHKKNRVEKGWVRNHHCCQRTLRRRRSSENSPGLNRWLQGGDVHAECICEFTTDWGGFLDPPLT